MEPLLWATAQLVESVQITSIISGYHASELHLHTDAHVHNDIYVHVCVELVVGVYMDNDKKLKTQHPQLWHSFLLGQFSLHSLIGLSFSAVLL